MRRTLARNGVTMRCAPASVSFCSRRLPCRRGALGCRSGRYHLGMAQATKLTKLEVERRRAAAERARGMLGHDPSRAFSDELIAGRRAEARAEDREDEARRRRAGR